jgi:thiamine-phosphate pyrophosphorylase
MDKNISKLQYLTQDLPGITHAELAAKACQGGASWVQLRCKKISYEDYLQHAVKTKLACESFHTTLIINDNVKVALNSGAHGVHLGQQDMSVKEARKIAGDNFIIGATANCFIDIFHAFDSGADYVGLGPFRFTTTKKNLSPVLGIEGIERVVELCKARGINIPMIAIGGITKADVPEILSSGVHGIAISSAISCAVDPEAETKEFLNLITQKKNEYVEVGR